MGLVPTSAEDNVALWIRHGGKAVVYAAACASLEGLAGAFDDVDVLLFDGTFWSSDELVAAGLSRARAEDMAHLPVGGERGSLAKLASSRARRRIYTHVNNSNPLLVDGSPEREAARAAGWEIAWDGMEIAP
jgi:pyrroloquinoline quinone biosynthesis protein B